MTVAFQRMFGILERWNNNQVTPSLSKPHEVSYRSNRIFENIQKVWSICKDELVTLFRVIFTQIPPKCKLPKLIIRHNIGPISAANSRIWFLGQCRTFASVKCWADDLSYFYDRKWF